MFGFIWFNKFAEKDYNMKKVMMRGGRDDAIYVTRSSRHLDRLR